MFRSRCQRGVHRFQPRYSVVAPAWLSLVENIKGLHPKEAYEKHYVCDVCVRCGKTIKT